ncbi:hypothetical protein T492DRAFT_1088604 [Pavlovales sp. CCMP2436]|nr:hypothetical protein T492DRAFT_1088604 [Pavlovales sp. CCMP2436]
MGACTTAPTRMAAGAAKLRGRAARSTSSRRLRESLELAARDGAGLRFCLPERLCEAAGLSSKGTHGRQLDLYLPAGAPVDKDGYFQLGPTARSHASKLAGHVGWGVAILSDQYTGEVRPLRVAQPADAGHRGPKRASTVDTEALRLLILETCPADAGHRGAKHASTVDTEALRLLILEPCPNRCRGPKKRT